MFGLMSTMLKILEESAEQGGRRVEPTALA